MFHAINSWLARQARRARDHRLTRDSAIAAASGWQVQRTALGTDVYRDPRFGQHRQALISRAARHAACGPDGCQHGYRTCAQEPLTPVGGRCG
jgi:hypothetical protein